MIEQAIAGWLNLAYFLSRIPCALAVEIDDHRKLGEGFLLSIYTQVVSRLGNVRPSILARSPRGLHCHWFLTFFIPWAILDSKLREKLRGLPVEVRPTPSAALRIPKESLLIDPETLLPLRRRFEDVVEEAQHYHPAVLLDSEVMPEAIIESFKTRRSKLRRFKALERLARIEANIGCVIPGFSNDALCQLIPIYRSAGMNAEEAAARFMLMLAPTYDGELRSWPRLLQRVECFYRNQRKTVYQQPQVVQKGLFWESIAEQIAALWPDQKRACQRRETIKKLVLGILAWKSYIDGVKKDASAVARWDYLYPYFRVNTRRAYYPLPQTVMRRFCFRNFEYVPWLQAVGFLEPGPWRHTYPSNANPNYLSICRYYRIHEEKFAAFGK